MSVSPRQIAECLEVDARTVRRWFEAGIVPDGYRSGGRWKIRQRSVTLDYLWRLARSLKEAGRAILPIKPLRLIDLLSENVKVPEQCRPFAQMPLTEQDAGFVDDILAGRVPEKCFEITPLQCLMFEWQCREQARLCQSDEDLRPLRLLAAFEGVHEGDQEAWNKFFEKYRYTPGKVRKLCSEFPWDTRLVLATKALELNGERKTYSEKQTNTSLAKQLGVSRSTVIRNKESMRIPDVRAIYQVIEDEIAIRKEFQSSPEFDAFVRDAIQEAILKAKTQSKLTGETVHVDPEAIELACRREFESL